MVQGVVLTHNQSARIIRSNQSLVLQKVTRQSSGNYSCSALNDEGETVSNQLELRVKCKSAHKGKRTIANVVPVGDTYNTASTTTLCCGVYV